MITIETTLQALQWACSFPPLETVELLYIAVRQVGRASLVSRRLNEPACWGHVGKTTQSAAETILYIVFGHYFHKGLPEQGEPV